jgi:putative aminopeptidase FrvX
MIASRLLDLLRELVEIESPSGSPGTAAVSQRVGRELEDLGASVELFDGGHLRAELSSRRCRSGSTANGRTARAATT